MRSSVVKTLLLCALAISNSTFTFGCDEGAGEEAPTLSEGQLRFGASFPGELVEGFGDPITDPQVSDADFALLVRSNTAFAFDMYRLADAQPPNQNQNLFYSPHSASVAFALAAPAPKNNPEALIRNLHFTEIGDELHPAMNRLLRSLRRHEDVTIGERGGDPFVLRMANGVWFDQDYPVDADTAMIAGGHYDAPVALLPFADDPMGSEALLNAWISDQTEDLIPELLKNQINPDTYFVSVNAIFFKASWKVPFSEGDTRDLPFQTPAGEVQAPTMTAEGSFLVAQTPAWDAVALPYVSDGMNLLLIAPAAGTFADFEASMSPDTLDEVLSSLQNRDTALSMPKFRIHSAVDLTELLEDPFAKAIHEADVALDEGGTVAAAATSVILFENGSPFFEPLAIDRPFVFLIQDSQTGAVLFMGRVLDPTK